MGFCLEVMAILADITDFRRNPGHLAGSIRQMVGLWVLVSGGDWDYLIITIEPQAIYRASLISLGKATPQCVKLSNGSFWRWISL